MTEGNQAVAASQSGATSMGKGAWDCDARKAIPPEKEVGEQEREGEREKEEEKREKKKNRRSSQRTKKQKTKFHFQAEVFEEIPTMDFPFHGIPTVPPRKDMTHLVTLLDSKKEREERERKERERERNLFSLDGKKQKNKKRKTDYEKKTLDLFLPRVPLPGHGRAFVHIREGQARSLGGRDLQVQQGRWEGEHPWDEAVGGPRERKFFFSSSSSFLSFIFSSNSEKEKKTRNAQTKIRKSKNTFFFRP